MNHYMIFKNICLAKWQFSSFLNDISTTNVKHFQSCSKFKGYLETSANCWPNDDKWVWRILINIIKYGGLWTHHVYCDWNMFKLLHRLIRFLIFLQTMRTKKDLKNMSELFDKVCWNYNFLPLLFKHYDLVHRYVCLVFDICIPTKQNPQIPGQNTVDGPAGNAVAAAAQTAPLSRSIWRRYRREPASPARILFHFWLDRENPEMIIPEMLKNFA